MKADSRQSQQGFAHIGVLVGAVLLVGVIGLVAWRVWDAQQNNSPTDAAVQQALANVQCDGADKDICKFYASWKASSSYKVTSASDYAGQKVTSTFESSDSGKRYHMVTNIAGKPYEVIGIDNTTYTKAADGTWWKQTIEPGKDSEYKDEYTHDFADPEQTADQAAAQKTSYKLMGKEACGDRTCFKYQVVDPNSPDLIQYIWFDDRDYQLRRMRTETKDGSTDQSYGYDKVSINEPSPVKELGANQVLNPTTGEVMTLPDQSDAQKQLEALLNGAE